MLRGFPPAASGRRKAQVSVSGHHGNWVRGSLGCVELTSMSDDDLVLFGIKTETVTPAHVALPIRQDQVENIRLAFGDAGINSQHERKALVEAAAARDVPSLRHLTAIEGRRVLSRIKERKVASPETNGSSWDMREEDTWIDRM